ncbi:glycine oxidase ThiO [Alkalihalobacillus sp. AL-G]|uniref:glycine oxidase ThiO n=1 Tax=Alkalihalobacillus sp. AL-G TaxID=2926399 RepID=UPI002729B582|nr:glycine oxidase ThiO [Alkalihalobacillus sp. AL-G]WLD93894.1 glycine oxidase ThiO [Alkalihalobacillus sp. AL-G]
MRNHFDVIIIGAGVIGSSIAFNLVKQGRSVLVLEKGRIASQSSSAAAGMLGAQTELENDSPLFRLARESRGMFPDLALELKDLTGIDIELYQNGMLKVARSEEEASEFQRFIALQQKLGEEASWIDPYELQQREPLLEKKLYGAMSIPNDGNVSAPNLTKALSAAAMTSGAEIKEFTEVSEFVTDGNGITGVITTTQEAYHADRVIVAGGAWSRRLLKDAGHELDTYPVKGECFSVKTEKPIVNATIFSKGCYIVPKSGGRLIIGATEKAHSFDQKVSLESIAAMMGRATELIPALNQAEWDDAWAGIRPQTKDGLPYLGVHPEINGLFIATGHYRNGILLAPITGKLMADLVEGIGMNKDWATAFRLERNVIGVEKQ